MAWLGELGVRKLGGQHPQVIRIDSAWLATARQLLPANLPRRKIRHEPESTTCQCGCRMQRIGEDVAEKLDYVPGMFTVERHIRGKWACVQCETITQAPVKAHVIDKGIPTAGLLAQVLVAKYADHLPLYRQETIFARRRDADANAQARQGNNTPRLPVGLRAWGV